tara:strand:+ start:646 stop:888 length:243 start_codon:yes stop_codon:yes gene_type:complete
MTMTYTHVMQIENNLSVTKPSMLSGLENTMVLDITFEQYDAWRDGTLIQDAMPNLTPDEREFLMTDITSEEWDNEYKEES